MIKTDAEVLALLSAGYKLRYTANENSGCELVHCVGEVSIEQINRLYRQGYLDSFANSGGYRISDKGKAAYISRTDELRKEDQP